MAFLKRSAVWILWGALLGPQALHSQPWVIAHRGASGELPEHTLESFKRAIEQGAHWIEPDLVITQDGVLIARHENELSNSTNVADVFPNRKTKKNIDGQMVEGWFSEDFTWAEIQRLRARQTFLFRDQSFNDQYKIPRLEQVLDLIVQSPRKLGVYPETKHSSYFRSLDLGLEERLIQVLREKGFEKFPHRVLIQSFEVENLKWLKRNSPYSLIQLVGEPDDRPFDRPDLTYARMLTDSGLREIQNYARGIGAYKFLICRRNFWGDLSAQFGWHLRDNQIRRNCSRLVEMARSSGLLVHAWTFRSDPGRLPLDYGVDPLLEYERFFKEGVDAVFSDYPQHALQALKKYQREGER